MNYAIILAAGVGQRMRNGGMPKQFLKLMGKPIVVYTLEKFEQCEDVDKIVIVCHGGYTDYMKKIIDLYQIAKVEKIIVGGKDRQESLCQGLEVVKEIGGRDDDIVIIHDGVRPLVDITTIQENIRVAKMYGCAITAHPVTETVVITDKDSAKIDDLKKRSDTYSMTAPQSFQIGKILYAYEKLKDIDCGDVPLLDAAMVYAKTVGDIQIVKEQGLNIKITTPEDYYYLKAILELQENKYVFGL